MANLNPLQLLSLLRTGNPQQVVQQIINTNYPNDTNMQQLLQMGKNNDIQGLQRIAQQVLGNDRNINQELNNLMNLIGGR